MQLSLEHKEQNDRFVRTCEKAKGCWSIQQPLYEKKNEKRTESVTIQCNTGRKVIVL